MPSWYVECSAAWRRGSHGRAGPRLEFTAKSEDGFEVQRVTYRFADGTELRADGQSKIETATEGSVAVELRGTTHMSVTLSLSH